MVKKLETDFDNWADIYDSIYAYVKEDISFYREFAKKCSGPVLELGCGTGRVSIPVAETGVEIYGLDSSDAMLEVARRKADSQSLNNICLKKGDMRTFDLQKTFNLVYIPFRGFLSLLNVEDQLSSLASIKKHIGPEGLFVFNIFVPDLDMLVQAGDSAYHLRDVYDTRSDQRFIIWHQSEYDNHNQIMSARIIVDQVDNVGSVTDRFYRDFKLRYIHRWEMQHLLTIAGFEVVDIFGDFGNGAFDDTSEEMIWVARPIN